MLRLCLMVDLRSDAESLSRSHCCNFQERCQQNGTQTRASLRPGLTPPRECSRAQQDPKDLNSSHRTHDLPVKRSSSPVKFCA
eukprot:g13948.t1